MFLKQKAHKCAPFIFLSVKDLTLFVIKVLKMQDLWLWQNNNLDVVLQMKDAFTNRALTIIDE